ncbi:hypothetical protein V1511DRAFT_460408 [Dipodascopsis uninucleata]
MLTAVRCQQLYQQPHNSFNVPVREFHSSLRYYAPKILNQATPIEPSKGGAIQDFDLLQDLPRPPLSIDNVVPDGFLLSDNTTFDCKNGTVACAIIGAFSFEWDFLRYCTGLEDGVVDIDLENGLSLLQLIYPRPELLLIGLGGKSRILNEKTKNGLMGMGYKIEVTDTINAASNFELLATERPNQIIAILLPMDI